MDADQSPRAGDGNNADLAKLAEQAGMRVDLLSMGAASMVYSDGCEGVTREHLQRFAALVAAATAVQALPSGWNFNHAQHPEGGLALTDLERAAQACELEHVGESVDDYCDNEADRGYNMALRHAAAAIRALAAQPVMVNGLTEAETSATASVMGLTQAPAEGDALRSEALLHAGKCRTMAARLFNDPEPSRTDAGDRLLYAAQLLDAMAAANVQPKGTARELLEAFPGCGDMPGMERWCGQVRAFLRAEPSQAPAPAPLAGTPPRADYVKAARVYALAYGLHDDAPSYLPRTQADADMFEPHAWVIGAMMQAFGDGWADGHAAGREFQQAAQAPAVGAEPPASYRRDYPTSEVVLGAEHDKAKADLRAYGVGFCVNGWHVPADKVSCWGMERASELTRAARDVVQERRRQVYAEGWTPEHDDEHGRGEMARAAACYALHAASQASEHPGISLSLESSALGVWPWDQSWHKPSDPRRNLVKAGALILAELERLDRISDVPVQGSQS